MTTPVLYKSNDLNSWIAVTVPAGTTRVVYGNNILLALSITDVARIYSSDDFGATWTQRIQFLLSVSVSGMDFINGQFLLYLNGQYGTLGFGYHDGISGSIDGITWGTSALATAYLQTSAKFLFFKGKYCCISTDGTTNYYHELNAGVWTDTVITGGAVIASDETVAASGSYIILIRNDNTAWSSPDGTTWTQLSLGYSGYQKVFLVPFSLYFQPTEFLIFCTNSGDPRTLVVAGDTLDTDTTKIGLFDNYTQPIFESDGHKCYALDNDNKIWQSPLPPTGPNWTTVSTGIPGPIQLKQLLH